MTSLPPRLSCLFSLTFAALSACCLSTDTTGMDRSTSGGSTTTGGAAMSSKPYQGTIIFETADRLQYNAVAGFSPTSTSAVCPAGSTLGSCCYFSADAGAMRNMAEPYFGDISAGTLALADGNKALANMPFQANVGGYTPIGGSAAPASFSWSPGDTLGVIAGGDPSGVASFSGTIVAPPPLPAMSPDFSTLSSLSRAGDFDLSWTATNSETVTLVIIAVAPPSDVTADGQILCRGSSASGALTVPAALLGKLPSGDTAHVELAAANTASVVGANATVELIAQTFVSTAVRLQ
jgi:hypothetical protein